jgi:3-dehydroquinate synthase
MAEHHTFTFGTYSCTVVPTTRSGLTAVQAEERFVLADSNTAVYTQDDPGMIIPAGEASKSWDRLRSILDRLLEADVSRTGVLVGVGGGVVTDIASLAASLYMRGIRLVLVPTSLLAMVDAALGGKTGIDLGGYKNLVGTFFPAEEVRICIDVLGTLPEREYRSGLAELLKTGMLGDPVVVEKLEAEPEAIAARDSELLEDLVWRCVMVKGGIVEQDLTESGVRAHLNLGHTFAHALEAIKGLGEWSHGEAVAWGLARATELGERLGITDKAYAERIRALLDRYEYRVERMPEVADRVVDAMRKDKKRRGSQMRFIVQASICDTSIVQVESDLVHAVLVGE